ncbi:MULTISPECIES: hypothetical protein [Chitinophagaceae]
MKRKLNIAIVTAIVLLASCSKNDSTGYQPKMAVDSSHATVSKILEYNPAPGQQVNKDGVGTNAAALTLAYDSSFTRYVTLGAWGGSVTFKFDHSVQNLDGADLAIYGNCAFEGWDEPGIVMVSQDLNNNGIADDPWYELAGSQYDSASTNHNYKVTYYNTGNGKDVVWKDNEGNTGSILFNNFGFTNFYPLNGANVNYDKFKDSISFEGAILRNTLGPGAYAGFNANNTSGLGWWGYADSYTDGSSTNKNDNYKVNGYNPFDIGWARDKNGNKVTLQYIDFVKVYTGQLISDPVMGEVSTEFGGARDLHLTRL